MKQLYIIITGNDDIGYYSKEVVPFEKVEKCIEGISPNIPISSKLFKGAFIGQSNNNAAFMAAILRNEKLIAAVVDAVKKHSIQPNWEGWKTGMLKDASKAKPFEPESSPVLIDNNSELDDADIALLERIVVDVEEEPTKSRSKKS
jgi:hypothetical protein